MWAQRRTWGIILGSSYTAHRESLDTRSFKLSPLTFTRLWRDLGVNTLHIFAIGASCRLLRRQVLRPVTPRPDRYELGHFSTLQISLTCRLTNTLNPRIIMALRCIFFYSFIHLQAVFPAHVTYIFSHLTALTIIRVKLLLTATVSLAAAAAGEPR